MTKSEARRNYWKTVTPEKRSEMARKAAVAKWASISVEDRVKHAMLMVKARS